MSAATVSLIGFCLIMLFLILYFCCWAHKRRSILATTAYYPGPTIIMRQRRVRTHPSGHRTTVFTIPMSHSPQPPPSYGAYANQPVDQQGHINILVTPPYESDLPPTYEEVTKASGLNGTQVAERNPNLTSLQAL